MKIIIRKIKVNLDDLFLKNTNKLLFVTRSSEKVTFSRERMTFSDERMTFSDEKVVLLSINMRINIRSGKLL